MWFDLSEYAVIQINDTHPSMVIPELIRLLMEKEIEFEEAVEESATIAEEIKEEFGFEEATEIIEEVAEEALVDEVIKAELEDDDDDFFTEMTIDAVVDNTIDEERDNAGISEEEVFKAIDAITFDDDVPEGGRIEFVTADGAEEILLNEESEDDSPIAEAEEEFGFEEAKESEDEFSFEEAAEVEEEFSFEEAEEVEEELSFEEAKEAEEEFSFEEVKEAEEDVVTEVAEEAEADAAEAVETAAEEPVIKAWSFLDDVVGAAGTVAGVTYVSKAMDEVVDEEVTEDDIEEVFVNFAEENKEIKSEPEAVAESVQAPVAEKKEESAYCNNLEKILIVPAQLNPMPLPEGTEVQGKTILLTDEYFRIRMCMVCYIRHRRFLGH